MRLFKRLIASWINITLIIAIIIVAGIALASTFGGSGAEVFVVERGMVVEEVEVTGQTEPTQHVDLSYEQAGRVTEVLVVPGSQVPAGATLIRLDAGELAGAVRQAQARVDSELARMAEIRRGSRQEEVRITEASVTSAEVALDNARRDLEAEIKSAAANADDALRTHADKLFDVNQRFGITLRDDSLSGSVILFLSGTPNERSMLNTGRGESDQAVDNLRALRTSGDILTASRQAQTSLETIADFFTDLAQVVSSFSNENINYRSSIDNYRNIVSAGRTQITNTLSQLRAAERTYRNAQASLESARRELELRAAGPTRETVALQQAAIDQARGSLEVALAQYDKSQIISPFAGTVAKVNAKVGNQVTAGTVAATVISPGTWEVDARVSEVDIGKIRVGNPVAITIDALPGQMFKGRVTRVDTAETVVDGVINYGVKIIFEGDTRALKSGMTANLKIQTEVKRDVLVLPQVALIERDEGIFAQKLVAGEIREVPVVVGTRGRNGTVEIVSGLSEGDQVENIGLRIDD